MSNLLGKLLAFKPILRLVSRQSEVDASTEGGRTRERNRRAALTAAASAAARIISAAAAIISVPFTLHYLGSERYGLWMALSSVIAFINFADLGIGNSIVSAVANAQGKDDVRAVRRYISSSYVSLCFIALMVGLVFCILYALLPWSALFGVTSDLARAEVGPSLVCLIACFVLSLPVNIIQRIQLGLQKGFVSSLWQCASSILAVIALIVAIQLNAGLPVLILALMGVPILVMLINTFVFFAISSPAFAPAVDAVTTKSIREVCHTGFLFLVLQIVGAVLYTSDNILIAHLMGASAVTDYSVPQRMFAIVGVLIGVALGPLWPAYSEALSRNDRAWVRITFLRSLKYAFMISSCVSAALIVFGNWVIHLWVGPVVTANLLLLSGLGVWQVIQACGSSFSMYLNGANVVGFQVVTAISAAVLGIILKIYFLSVIGISGVIWATSVSYVICVAVPMFLFLKRDRIFQESAR